MITLLYDLTATQPSGKNKFHGGGLYGEVIFFALIERLSELRMICVYDAQKYINPNILECCKKYKLTLYDVNRTPPDQIIDKENIDTFYTSLARNESMWKFEVPEYIITYHGIREIEIPIDPIAFKYASGLKEKLIVLIKRLFWNSYFKKKYYNNYKQQLQNKTAYITITEHSKASLISFFPELRNRDIKVWYSPLFDQLEGEYAHKINMRTLLPQELNNIKYFLLTSSARWNKNNLRAVIACDQLFSQQPDLEYKIVLTGVTDKYIYSKYIKNPSRFIFYDFVDRALLNSLHANAYAFIYPSLNEGFGYPPIESMKYGVPVVASGTSSIPEVCDNAALYFDPYSISEIKNRIVQLLDKNIYLRYKERAYRRYTEVSAKQKKDLDEMITYLLTVKK